MNVITKNYIGKGSRTSYNEQLGICVKGTTSSYSSLTKLKLAVQRTQRDGKGEKENAQPGSEMK